MVQIKPGLYICAVLTVMSWIFLFSSCGNSSGLIQTENNSSCGGFKTVESRSGAGQEDDYCMAEKLAWTYDRDSQVLSLTNFRIGLNCCGDHSMWVEEEPEGYVIHERDDLHGGVSRCGCSCVYDFSVAVEEFNQGSYHFRIVRTEALLKEDGVEFDIKEIWSGDIDLSIGSGVVEIDSMPFHESCRYGLS